jgi:hypothetical protein
MKIYGITGLRYTELAIWIVEQREMAAKADTIIAFSREKIRLVLKIFKTFHKQTSIEPSG